MNGAALATIAGLGVMAATAGMACRAAHGPANASTSAKADAGPDAGGTRRAPPLRAGDFVVYRYSGTLVPVPVTLREEVVAQSGSRFVIDVVATRGAERRHWQQMTDGAAQAVREELGADELWVFDGEERRKIGSDRAAELHRLYEWALVLPPRKKAEVREVGVGSVGFAGNMHTCDRETGASSWKGRAIRFETYDCPDFEWTRGPARYWDEATNETLMRVDVARAEHETLCDYDVSAAAPACSATEVCAFVERGRSACVTFAKGDVDLIAPFRAGQTFVCTQGARSKAGRSHSFVGDIFAVDLAIASERAGVEVIAPVSGEAFVFDTCEERDDAASAHNSSRCGLGYGNHVKIWDGKTIVLLAHLARARIGNGPVKRGDVIGIAGVSGAAGHRHVHVTVTRPLPGEDARPLLTTPGFKGAVPVKWRVATAATRSIPVDELACHDDMARAEPMTAGGP